MSNKKILTSTFLVLTATSYTILRPETLSPSPRQATDPQPTHAQRLRGDYGRYRANNDLLYYHLDIRVDPDKKFLSGKNTIRFRMLSDDNRIQIELHPSLAVDRILLDGAPLKYTREESAVFIDFPQMLNKGTTY